MTFILLSYYLPGVKVRKWIVIESEVIKRDIKHKKREQNMNMIVIFHSNWCENQLVIHIHINCSRKLASFELIEYGQLMWTNLLVQTRGIYFTFTIEFYFNGYETTQMPIFVFATGCSCKLILMKLDTFIPGLTKLLFLGSPAIRSASLLLHWKFSNQCYMILTHLITCPQIWFSIPIYKKKKKKT